VIFLVLVLVLDTVRSMEARKRWWSTRLVILLLVLASNVPAGLCDTNPQDGQ
jgi:hypothetical protein